jgi:hypothetical protein
MKIMSSWLKKQIAGCLVRLLAVPFAEAATPPQQVAPRGQQSQSAPVAQNHPETSDAIAAKPEADTNLAENDYPDSPVPAPPQASSQSAPSGSDQQQSPPPAKPVGTAAAPYEVTTGVAASRPAGAVIAPAKQRRVRIILIRTAVVVGAAVAVGSVVALSKGSPSRPN